MYRVASILYSEDLCGGLLLLRKSHRELTGCWHRRRLAVARLRSTRHRVSHLYDSVVRRRRPVGRGVRAAALSEGCSRAPIPHPTNPHSSPLLVVVTAGSCRCGRGWVASSSPRVTRRGQDGGSQAEGWLQPRLLERSSEPELSQARKCAQSGSPYVVRSMLAERCRCRCIICRCLVCLLGMHDCIRGLARSVCACINRSPCRAPND